MLGITSTNEALAAEQQWRHAGGIASLSVAVGYVAIILLFAWVGAPPTTGDAWFHYLTGKTTAWWIILWLSVITDLCYLPVAWALYFVLRQAARGLMHAATLLLHLFVVLDLAVTWTHHASILALYRNYVSDTNAVHRSAYLAAAEYASSIYATPLLTCYIITIPSLGVLLASMTMSKARFGQVIAWTGLTTGVLGFFSLTGFLPFVMANALGATLWFSLIGVRLLSGSKRR